MASDKSTIDGPMYIADDELYFLSLCKKYDIKLKSDSESFEFRGTDSETQEDVTVIRRYGKFQKEADVFLELLRTGGLTD